MTTVVKEVVDAQQQSNAKFVELEEKRMRFEAEQRKEEREFQLRMMSMLFGNPGAPAPLLVHTVPTNRFLVT